MPLDNLKTILNAIKYLLTEYPKKKDIPTKLPNPNPLTFTGAVTGSYDGTAAVTVEIPESVTELYLKSSTAGSTKKFKITVDDSGTISATEVT